jgi:hypothetical protein
MSMKNSNDTIGNRTRDLAACSAVPQPTAHQQRAPNPHYVANWYKCLCRLGGVRLDKWMPKVFCHCFRPASILIRHADAKQISLTDIYLARPLNAERGVIASRSASLHGCKFRNRISYASVRNFPTFIARKRKDYYLLTDRSEFIKKFATLQNPYTYDTHCNDMIWYIYDMTWYDTIRYMIWYDMIWYDMIWYDMIWYDMIWYNCNWVDTRWQ